MVDELSHREVAEILDLIQRIECTELTLDYGGFSIRLVRGDAGGAGLASAPPARVREPATNPISAANAEIESPPPQPAPEAAGGVPPSTAAWTPADWVAVRSPMVATFYAAPSPGAEPFVSLGDKVTEGSTLCMLEVMKLYSEIKAECSGTVARIDALDGQLVEHDQVLMWIEPA